MPGISNISEIASVTLKIGRGSWLFLSINMFITQSMAHNIMQARTLISKILSLLHKTNVNSVYLKIK